MTNSGSVDSVTSDLVVHQFVEEITESILANCSQGARRKFKPTFLIFRKTIFFEQSRHFAETLKRFSRFASEKLFDTLGIYFSKGTGVGSVLQHLLQRVKIS